MRAPIGNVLGVRDGDAMRVDVANDAIRRVFAMHVDKNAVQHGRSSAAACASPKRWDLVRHSNASSTSKREVRYSSSKRLTLCSNCGNRLSGIACRAI